MRAICDRGDQGQADQRRTRRSQDLNDPGPAGSENGPIRLRSDSWQGAMASARPVRSSALPTAAAAGDAAPSGDAERSVRPAARSRQGRRRTACGSPTCSTATEPPRSTGQASCAFTASATPGAGVTGARSEGWRRRWSTSCTGPRRSTSSTTWATWSTPTGRRPATARSSSRPTPTYSAPIFAVPGNHDGELTPASRAGTLAALPQDVLLRGPAAARRRAAAAATDRRPAQRLLDAHARLAVDRRPLHQRPRGRRAGRRPGRLAGR